MILFKYKERITISNRMCDTGRGPSSNGIERERNIYNTHRVFTYLNNINIHSQRVYVRQHCKWNGSELSVQEIFL